MQNNSIVELKGISKAFGGIPVLRDVDFTAKIGLIHGLVGGNGAGKSTLMKILAGVHQPDQGEIRIKGERVRLKNPAEAHDKGIYLVPQEPLLFPYLTVEENILLTTKKREQKAYKEKILLLMDTLKCEFSLDQLGADLTLAKQQLVELLRGLVRESEVIILDEPTSALTAREVTALFENLRRMVAEKKTAIIYITHRLQELFEITDELTILKNGQVVLQEKTCFCTLEQILQIMVPKVDDEGSDSANICPLPDEAALPHSKEVLESPVLEVNSMWGKGFRDVSLVLNRGEILGLTGVVGAGRTEFAEALFGITKRSSGIVKLDGRQIEIREPREAILQGIVYLPEDRHLHGGFLEAGIPENITSPILFRLFKVFLQSRKEMELAAQFVEKLRIQASSLHQKFKYLSGGNQQKVVLSKCLAAEPKVMILDEPTRGIDANARKEIYANIRELADCGIGVLLISSDFEEITLLCHRVLIMYRERIVAELIPPHITLENITFASFGYTKGVGAQ